MKKVLVNASFSKSSSIRVASLSNSHTSPHCLDSSKCSRNCPTAVVPLAVEGGGGADAGSAEVDEKVRITSVRLQKAPDRSSACLSPLDSLPLDGLSSDCLICFEAEDGPEMLREDILRLGDLMINL